MSVEETPRTFRTNVVRTKQHNVVYAVSCSEDGGVPYIGETKQKWEEWRGTDSSSGQTRTDKDEGRNVLVLVKKTKGLKGVKEVVRVKWEKPSPSVMSSEKINQLSEVTHPPPVSPWSRWAQPPVSGSGCGHLTKTVQILLDWPAWLRKYAVIRVLCTFVRYSDEHLRPILSYVN